MTTYTDVAVSLGRPITDPNQQAQVNWWITGAEMLIQARLGDLGDLDADVLNYVVVEAIAAKVNRAAAGGASSITVNVDDSGVTRRFESPVTASDITDEWWALLSPSLTTGAYSVRPGFEPDSAGSEFLDSWT